ncbi:ferredoxin [Hoeflea sp. YIM 152468]|uniref:ferredoxin n=1 Tax=Hoeflea sp. YIM 152468 TaxID=3031759 RepID=UPI0023DAE460|nr:ferredoxin [Hoeflea sp. YIM 152468]MDF1607609.1 ferredoxin [Hoeflea sp. YIM 152468]
MANVIAPDRRINSLLAGALAAYGLCIRGWVVPDGESPLAKAGLCLAAGEPAHAVCLVGHGGGGFWPIFAAWHRLNSGVREPLDSWSKSVITPIARAVGGEAVFPSDKPWRPFQQWGMAAEGLKASPLGMLIHPVYGLWHGYRGAILFSALDVSGWPEDVARLRQITTHPCDSCATKPCLTRCPVDAFKPDGLAVTACRDHLNTVAGQQGCMTSGCLAREACPVGQTYRYSAAQIRFYMTAFA